MNNAISNFFLLAISTLILSCESKLKKNELDNLYEGNSTLFNCVPCAINPGHINDIISVNRPFSSIINSDGSKVTLDIGTTKMAFDAIWRSYDNEVYKLDLLQIAKKEPFECRNNGYTAKGEAIRNGIPTKDDLISFFSDFMAVKSKNYSSVTWEDNNRTIKLSHETQFPCEVFIGQFHIEILCNELTNHVKGMQSQDSARYENYKKKQLEEKRDQVKEKI